MLTILLAAACASAPVVAHDIEPVVEPVVEPPVDQPAPLPAVTIDPDAYAIWGIDVSHHQHVIDWPVVAQQERVRFAFMKATQGKTFTDDAFARNWSGARAAGLRVGAYHYYSFCSDSSSQAAHFLSVVPRDADALPPVLDVEHLMNCATDPDPEKVRAELRNWLVTVEAATGKRPMVYATSDVLADYFLGSELDYPLWVRATPEDPEPVLQLPWKFLQYDDQHAIDGIDTTVDRDVFSGDEAAFKAL